MIFKVRISKVFSCLNLSFFIFLYIGFVLYNVLVGYGYFPAFFGGYFGLFTLLHLLFLLPFVFFSNINRLSHNGLVFLAGLVLYILYTSSIAVYCYFVGGPDVRLGVEQHFVYVLTLLSSVALFYGADFYGKKTKMFMFLWLLVSFLFLILYIVSSGKPMFYMRDIASIEDVTAISTYQGFSRSFLVVGFVLLAASFGVRQYLILCAVLVFVLFVLGSRSEFVAFLFSSGLFFISFLRYRTTYLKLLFFALPFFLFVFLMYEDVVSYFQQSRIFQLIDIGAASSWQVRGELQAIAINQLTDNPFFGFFAGHILATGSSGGYAHNILSAWVNYGLLPFFLYVLLTSFPFVWSAHQVFLKKNVSKWMILCFFMSSASMLLLIFTKSVFWFFPGFAFGLYLRLQVKKND